MLLYTNAKSYQTQAGTWRTVTWSPLQSITGGDHCFPGGLFFLKRPFQASKNACETVCPGSILALPAANWAASFGVRVDAIFALSAD